MNVVKPVKRLRPSVTLQASRNRQLTVGGVIRTRPKGRGGRKSIEALAVALHSGGGAIMGKKLDAAQLTSYARQQIRAAQAIERQHRVDRLGLCSCGRPQPCAVITACLATITHYTAKLALLGATVPLPVIGPHEDTGS